MRQAHDRGGDEGLEMDELDPRRRATLLESQADELRQRLDSLLDEIAHDDAARSHRLERQ